MEFGYYPGKITVSITKPGYSIQNSGENLSLRNGRQVILSKSLKIGKTRQYPTSVGIKTNSGNRTLLLENPIIPSKLELICPKK